MRGFIEKQPSVSITYDFWTSLSCVSMMGITLHFIDEKFVMRRFALAVREVQGTSWAR
jgi:hypothetical protein